MLAFANSAMSIRVVFFGDSRSVFSNRHFDALTESASDIVAVVDAPLAKRKSTNPTNSSGVPSFTEIAKRRSIPTFEPDSPNRPEFIQTMQALSPDLFMAVGYTNLLKPQLVAVPRLLAANFHASLLPAYRGRHPVFWALRNGERWAGLTVHAMDNGLDTGAILYQVRVRTRRRDSVAMLYDRIIDQSVSLVSQLLDDLGRDALAPMPQGSAGASYYSSTTEEDFRLDWSRDAEKLRRWICTSPGQCFCEVAKQSVFLLDAECERLSVSRPSGTVVRIGRAHCSVATGKNLLQLRRVRLESGVEQSMAQLCRTLAVEVGSRLS